MSDEEMDPEVLADLRLRASSQYDSTRTRGAGLYEWKPPAVVTEWPCRQCGSMVPVDDAPVHAADVFDRELARRNEAPLNRNRIAFCVGCRDAGKKISADRNRKAVDMLADLVRQLKADPPPKPDVDAELYRKCKLLHHPDIDGLRQTLETKRTTKPAGKRERRGGM